MKRIVLISTICFVLCAIALGQGPKRSKPTDNDPAIDPRAIAALNRMSNYLTTLKSFKIDSEVTRDEVVDSNMKIQRNSSNEIVVHKPDRLLALVKGDQKDLRFIYDGKTLTLFDTRGKHYAQTPAPPTVARTLDAIRARYDIDFPLADFIQMASNENLLQAITRAGYIGTSRIGGVEAEHVAVRQSDVDWQVWIEKSETPLPRKLVITTKQEPTQPQYTSTLSWDVTPTLHDNMFAFTPPTDAVRIKFGQLKSNKKTTAEPQTTPKKK